MVLAVVVDVVAVVLMLVFVVMAVMVIVAGLIHNTVLEYRETQEARGGYR